MYIYTKKSRTEVEKQSPSVDHIVEIQILAHATAKVLYNRQTLKNKIQNDLKDSINVVENYNVTLGNINSSKQTIVKSFLKDKMYNGFPIASLFLGTQCEKHMKNIQNAMGESFYVVENNVRDIRRDGFVTGNSPIQNIGDELHFIFERMQLDNDEAPRTLRSKK